MPAPPAYEEEEELPAFTLELSECVIKLNMTMVDHAIDHFRQCVREGRTLTPPLYALFMQLENVANFRPSERPDHR